MKKYLFLLLVFLGFQTVQAQEQETIFSDLDFSGFWFDIGYNFSDFENDWALVRGWSINAEFGGDLTLGWGKYNLKDNVSYANGEVEMDMKYRGFIFGVAPRSYKAVHPRLSFLIGRGKVDVTNEDRDKVFVFQPSGGVEFNVAGFMRIGVEGGYRFVGGSDFEAVTNQDLSSAFIQLDLKFGFTSR